MPLLKFVPDHVYLILEGAQVRGIRDVSQDLTPRGERAIEVYAIDHGVYYSESDFDLVNQPVSFNLFRQHNPFTITKRTDPTTPKLYEALALQDTMDRCTLEFWGLTGTVMTKGYVVELTRARIQEIRFDAMINDGTFKLPYKADEHVSFIYRAIQWHWEEPPVEFMDEGQ